MARRAHDPMLVLASREELPIARRVWGSYSWVPPEKRVALDWLTLARLQGWGVSVIRSTRKRLDSSFSAESRWVIIACDPMLLVEEIVAELASKLASEPVMVVAPAAAAGTPLARFAGVSQRLEQITGRTLSWTGAGPGRTWVCQSPIEAFDVELSGDTSIWATVDGAPLIVSRKVGNGVLVTLCFHPSRARDTDGVVTGLLKHLLIWGSLAPVAWLDLDRTVVLRMDDAGGAQNVYLRSWYYRKLSLPEWNQISAELRRRNARLTVGYTIGWVDDGDERRGFMKVANGKPLRNPGYVHPTPLVKYYDCAGHAPGTIHDYQSEFQGIQALRSAGLGDVEIHGYTHIHPKSGLWASAPDRYENASLYHDLGFSLRDRSGSKEHPIGLAKRAFARYFGVRPTTLLCPQDACLNDDLERALDCGLSLVCSWELAIRDGRRFCWTSHLPFITAPDETPNRLLFEAGLPVIGRFHDRDVVVEGVSWMRKWIAQWDAAGARRMMDFRELAAAVGRRLLLDENDGNFRLTVKSHGSPALTRALSINIRIPTGKLPSHLSASIDGKVLRLKIKALGDGLARVTLSPT